MQPSTVAIYAGMADKRERDPISEDQGRATVPMGRGFNTWARFNNASDVVWVVTPEGKDAWLTRKQADLYQLALTYIDNGTTTIRFLALELKCAPSTVSRGMAKLASLGLLAALSGRGRYAGLLIFRLPANGSLDRFRVAAKARLLSIKQAAERRLSRLQFNVAPYYLEGESIRKDSLGKYLELVITKGATLKREWTVDELGDIR